MIDHDTLNQISNEFIITRRIELSVIDEVKLRKFLNVFHLGDVDCNELVNGVITAKYPEKETEEFKQATQKATTGIDVKLKLTYDVNGNCTVEIVK
jgi:hypothetical protein